MNASDLVNRVAERTGMSRRAVRAVLDIAYDEIAEGLEKDGRVSLSGFGTFLVRSRRERPGRNPLTGEPMTLPRRQTVIFRIGTRLRQLIERSPNVTR